MTNSPFNAKSPEESRVDDAIADSFPASDPPTWTSTTAGPPPLLAPATIPNRPAKALFGILPLLRALSPALHATLDYAGGALLLGVALTPRAGKSSRGAIAGGVLGGALVASSALSDQKPSASRLLPIEVHEVLDYAIGASALLAPFALNYRRDRVAARVHIAAGAIAIASALLTDYHAATGIRSVRRRAA